VGDLLGARRVEEAGVSLDAVAARELRQVLGGIDT
jgi:hypothetical protein